jgi:hypothetical protein
MIVNDAVMLKGVQDLIEFFPVPPKKGLPFTRGPLISDRRRWNGLFVDPRAGTPRSSRPQLRPWMPG